MKSSLYSLVKNTTKKSLHALGVDIVRYNAYNSNELLMKTIVGHFNIKTILDVGANVGLYARQHLNHGFKGKIYSFEPIGSVFQELQASASGFPNWTAFQLGIGSRNEEVAMNVSENLVSSSILKVGANSLSVQPQTRATRTESIVVKTLDSMLPELVLEKEILLKLDVQGYEMEALKGSLALLPTVKLIQIELSLVPVYDGAPLYQEAIRFLESHGFEMYAVTPGFTDGKTGRMLQIDGIFCRK